MAKLYIAQTAAVPGAASAASIPTTTAIRTLLQVATPSTTAIKVVEWGISFDGSAAATPIKVELFATTTAVTASTMTSVTPSPYDDPNAVASLCVGGTGATGTGFWASGTTEVSPSATRFADMQLIAPTSQYVKQWPLGREFQVQSSAFLRVRVTAGAAVNAYAYVIWEE